MIEPISLLQTLAEQGLVGIFLVGSLLLNWYQNKQLEKTKQLWINDIKELSKVQDQTGNAYLQTLTKLLVIVENVQDLLNGKRL